MRRNLNYKDDLLADLRNDLGFAAEYLSAAYGDSPEAFLVALRDVVEARKGMTKLAAQAKVNRENLYRSLSEEGNPRYSTFRSVLHALGMTIDVQIAEPAKRESETGSSPIRKVDNFTSTSANGVKPILNSGTELAAAIYLVAGAGLSAYDQIPTCADREVAELCAQGAVVTSARPLGESNAA